MSVEVLNIYWHNVWDRMVRGGSLVYILIGSCECKITKNICLSKTYDLYTYNSIHIILLLFWFARHVPFGTELWWLLWYSICHFDVDTSEKCQTEAEKYGSFPFLTCHVRFVIWNMSLFIQIICMFVALKYFLLYNQIQARIRTNRQTPLVVLGRWFWWYGPETWIEIFWSTRCMVMFYQ